MQWIAIATASNKRMLSQREKAALLGRLTRCLTTPMGSDSIGMLIP